MKKIVFILIAIQIALSSCKKQNEEKQKENRCVYGKWKLIKTTDAEGGEYDVDHNYENYLYLNDDFTYKTINDNFITTGNFFLINDTLKFTLLYSNQNGFIDSTTIYKYRIYDNKLQLNLVEPFSWTSSLLYKRE